MNLVYIVVSLIVRYVVGAFALFGFVKWFMPIHGMHFLFTDALGWMLGLELLRVPGMARRLVGDLNDILDGKKSNLDVILHFICANCVAGIFIYPVIIIVMSFVHWLVR